MRSLRILLAGIVDYAGLFPPAGLDMLGAVSEYAEHLEGPHRWALGRFVVPASRLEELGRAAEPWFPHTGQPWRLSALLGRELAADLAALRRFNDAHRGRAVVDAVELKAETPDLVGSALDEVGTWLDAYVELPVRAELPPLIRAAGERGGRVKLRTGGVTAEAFPAPPDLLHFIRAAIDAGVPFKATAGLHHPLCGSYPLTYSPDSAPAPMYGFLNVFVGAAFVAHGMGTDDATAVLTDTARDAFRFTDTAVEWRGWTLSDAQLARVRHDVATSFGSCSFREPITELHSLGLL
jgi:hypothetical protein